MRFAGGAWASDKLLVGGGGRAGYLRPIAMSVCKFGASSSRSTMADWSKRRRFSAPSRMADKVVRLVMTSVSTCH